MTKGDILEFSACYGNPGGDDVWKFWYALVINIHSFYEEFWNVTLLWDSGELTREHYHDLEFKVINEKAA